MQSQSDQMARFEQSPREPVASIPTVAGIDWLRGTVDGTLPRPPEPAT